MSVSNSSLTVRVWPAIVRAVSGRYPAHAAAASSLKAICARLTGARCAVKASVRSMLTTGRRG